MRQKTFKLKMLLRFYQSLFLSIFVFIPSIGHSQRSVLGIVEALEKTLNLDHQKLKKLNLKYVGSPKIITTDHNIVTVVINQNINRSIILNSNSTFLRFSKNDPCKFVSLLENKLVKTSIGLPDNILVDITYKKQKKETRLTPIKDYIKYVYQKHCNNYLQYSKIFNKQNIVNTLKGIEFKVHENLNNCIQNIKKWQSNNYFPYICSINNFMIRGSYYHHKGIRNEVYQTYRFYKNNISYYKRFYINKLCTNLYQPKAFCSAYSDHLVWQEIINGKRPKDLLSIRCQRLINRSELSIDQLRSCAHKLKNSPEICSYKKGRVNYALYPGPNCNQISDALKLSTLKTNYHDCPGEIANLALTNIFRIYNHFEKNLFLNENCKGQVYKTIYQLYQKYKSTDLWPYQICYQDILKDTKACRSFIPGTEYGKNSEAAVIAYILSRVKAAPINLKCRILSDQLYNPNLLTYKNGCFITTNKEKCKKGDCKKIIYYNTKEFSALKYQQKPFFDYFKKNYQENNFTLVNILKETIGLKDKKIENFTQLDYFFKKKKGIIHGIGCAEILSPRTKQSTSFNQCTPIPFILDGYQIKGFKVVLRTSNSDIQWPRIQHWNVVFNAVKTFQKYHPLRQWSLYGIYK